MLFLTFLVFSLCNTLFLVNYTIYPWIGSGIFRLAVFCNLKKRKCGSRFPHFFLISLQQGLLIPLFPASLSTFAGGLGFFVSTVSFEGFYMAWMGVCTNTSGWRFIWEGGSSPRKAWFVVCVSSHRFWQPRGFVSVGALLVSFCRESQTQAMLPTPCVCLRKWWVQGGIITYFQQPG